MNMTQMNDALDAVRFSFDKVIEGLGSSARDLITAPSLYLSNLLLTITAFGNKSADDAAIASARALELLDQALLLGESGDYETGFDEEKLLFTDYLYGQAIGQIIGINKPEVIDILARAISESAEMRVGALLFHYRDRLVVAAFDIGIHLADCSEPVLAAIKSARDAAGRSDCDVWMRLLPDGPPKAHLLRSMSMKTGD